MARVVTLNYSMVLKVALNYEVAPIVAPDRQADCTMCLVQQCLTRDRFEIKYISFIKSNSQRLSKIVKESTHTNTKKQ